MSALLPVGQTFIPTGTLPNSGTLSKLERSEQNPLKGKIVLLLNNSAWEGLKDSRGFNAITWLAESPYTVGTFRQAQLSLGWTLKTILAHEPRYPGYEIYDEEGYPKAKVRTIYKNGIHVPTVFILTKEESEREWEKKIKDTILIQRSNLCSQKSPFGVFYIPVKTRNEKNNVYCHGFFTLEIANMAQTWLEKNKKNDGDSVYIQKLEPENKINYFKKNNCKLVNGFQYPITDWLSYIRQAI